MKILKKGKEDLVAYSLFFLLLVVLSIYDFKYKAVPDYLLLFAFVLSFFITKYSFETALLNAFTISGAFVILNFIVTFYIQNIKARILKDESLKTAQALGEGDIPLIASFAVILGLYEAFFTIFLAAFIAIFHYFYIKYKKQETQIPFIPSLAVAFLLEFTFNISNIFKDYF